MQARHRRAESRLRAVLKPRGLNDRTRHGRRGLLGNDDRGGPRTVRGRISSGARRSRCGTGIGADRGHRGDRRTGAIRRSNGSRWAPGTGVRVDRRKLTPIESANEPRANHRRSLRSLRVRRPSRQSRVVRSGTRTFRVRRMSVCARSRPTEAARRLPRSHRRAGSRRRGCGCQALRRK